jgi:cardiolipin synthase
MPGFVATTLPASLPLALLDFGLELYALLPLAHLTGLYCAYRAIIYTRTAQGAIAWAVSLIILPYVSVPLYVVFGRRKFVGYVEARQRGDLAINHVAMDLKQHEIEFRTVFDEDALKVRAIETLAKMPFTSGNAVELLIDGEAIFGSILTGLREARDYVLIQFYIVNDDRLGREFKDLLVARARDGLRIYFLYDEIGCYALPNAYLDELRAAGLQVHSFLSTRGPSNRFQINFRNHRKIVIVDGRLAWVGGANVGDEYMGLDPEIGAWRDTQCRFEGPVVQCVQLAFLEDWYFAAGGIPSLDWTPQRAPGGAVDVLALPSGPADPFETASLFFVHAINAARSRLWIASPYFVPDERVVGALQLAALRGVEVRILLPSKADHLLIYLSSFSYLEELCGLGVTIYRYQPGFLHQKTMLVDDRLAVVGTANLDNRSFRLNFEITMLCSSLEFAGRMEAMFEADFANSEVATISSLEERSGWFQFAVKVARLMSPVQ